MTYSEQQKLDWLLAYAKHVADGIPALQSVDVESLAAQESIPIVRRQINETPQAANLLLADGRGRLVIKLKEPGENALTRKERFSVAHELGHVFLIRHFGWNPLAGEEHRICERLCNQFAAALLVPEKYLCSIQAKSAADIFKSIVLLSRICKASNQVVARRITERYSNVGIMSGLPKTNVAGARVIRVTWSTGQVLGEMINPHTHLNLTSPIGRLFSSVLNETGPRGEFSQPNGYDVFVQRFPSGRILLCAVARQLGSNS